MSHSKRHDVILERLAQNGAVSTVDLAEEFGVNIVTIRRDLATLASEGSLHRTRGGAAASRVGRVEFAFEQDRRTNLNEKRAISETVAASIHSGMSISLDTGTTTLEIARHIARTPDLKVLTSSLAVASTLYPHENIELVLLGGQARKGSPDLCGMLTEENLLRFRVDLAVLGADAVTSEGLYTTDIGVARVSQAMLGSAGSAVLAIDSSKFERTAFVRFAGWDSITRVVTDNGVPPGSRDWLAERATSVTYVPCRTNRGTT